MGIGSTCGSLPAVKVWYFLQASFNISGSCIPRGQGEGAKTKPKTMTYDKASPKIEKIIGSLISGNLQDKLKILL